MRELWRAVASALVRERYVREVAAPPDLVEQRLREAINRPPKRMLGVLKVSAHWVGAAAEGRFVVWERRDHATRAHGTIRGIRGGSSVQVELELTWRTRAMILVFFGLFALISLDLLGRQEGLGLGPAGLAAALAGALVTAALFWWASRRQRAALRAFIDQVIGGTYAPPA